MLPDYLQSKIMVVEDGCWLWTAALNSKGYGVVWAPDQSKLVLAHRRVWEMFNGPMPDGLVSDHLCRVTSCVNPDHIEPVTGTENLRRGNNFNAAKTHCPRGHEYTKDNTYPNQRGRNCRTCARARARAQHMKVAT